MSNVTGYVSLKNECGTVIKDASLSVSVSGDASPLIHHPSLAVGMTTLNKKYSFPSGSSTDWCVSFTLKGTQMNGTVNCQLTPADNNKMLKITLSADSFTIVPTVSDRATSMYTG